MKWGKQFLIALSDFNVEQSNIAKLKLPVKFSKYQFRNYSTVYSIVKEAI
jgi:hypothetical protein